MEPIIYKPGAYNTPGVYKGAGGVYNGRGVYNDGAGGGGGYIIGGREYRVVEINGKIWLAENLDYKFDDCEIGGDYNVTTPKAWYYNNDGNTYGIDGTYKCGLLYNWYAAKYLEDNKETLINGWHVPTFDEILSMINSIGGLNQGQKLKAAKDEITAGFPNVYWGGNNETGFTMIPAGIMNSGSFGNINSNGYLLSITESTSTRYKMFSFGNSSIDDSLTFNKKSQAITIRLVHD